MQYFFRQLKKVLAYLPGIWHNWLLYKLPPASTLTVSPEIKLAAGDNRKQTAADTWNINIHIEGWEWKKVYVYITKEALNRCTCRYLKYKYVTDSIILYNSQDCFNSQLNSVTENYNTATWIWSCNFWNHKVINTMLLNNEQKNRSPDAIANGCIYSSYSTFRFTFICKNCTVKKSLPN